MDWDTSNREAMLEALKDVLSGIEGVQYVDRQAITPELVGDAQLPAIIIDEARSRYRWLERHHSRTAKTSAGIVLDLQARAPRRQDGPGPAISSTREAFVGRVILELVEEATLNGTAMDAGNTFDVRYVPAKPPYARALVTIAVETQEVFDDRTRTDWERVIADIIPDGADEESIDGVEVDIDQE